ncbi:MAG: ATP-binding protein [Bacteroidota bacterium]
MEKTTHKKYRIAITGPESTGKSTLTEQLAHHYKTFWVEEYAREYLNSLGRDYVFEDIVEIAKGQIRNEEILFEQSETLLFCDTELIVTKIWSEVGYQKCDAWILENIIQHPYDLYLLCNTDTPWEYDPLREHPNQRGYLFDLYQKALVAYSFNFRVVKGIGIERFNNALNFVNEVIKNK